MEQGKLDRVALAARRALERDRFISSGDAFAAGGAGTLSQGEVRAALEQLVTQGVIRRVAHDLYGPVRDRAARLPGRSYVSDLMQLTAAQLMVARA